MNKPFKVGKVRQVEMNESGFYHMWAGRDEGYIGVAELTENNVFMPGGIYQKTDRIPAPEIEPDIENGVWWARKKDGSCDNDPVLLVVTDGKAFYPVSGDEAGCACEYNFEKVEYRSPQPKKGYLLNQCAECGDYGKVAFFNRESLGVVYCYAACGRCRRESDSFPENRANEAADCWNAHNPE